MTGKHLTEDQVLIYRATRQAHTLQHAAKIASISRSSGSRIDNSLWEPQKHRSRRTRRSKLSGVWDGDALPYLAENRGLLPKMFICICGMFFLFWSPVRKDERLKGNIKNGKIHMDLLYWLTSPFFILLIRDIWTQHCSMSKREIRQTCPF